MSAGTRVRVDVGVDVEDLLGDELVEFLVPDAAIHGVQFEGLHFWWIPNVGCRPC